MKLIEKGYDTAEKHYWVEGHFGEFTKEKCLVKHWDDLLKAEDIQQLWTSENLIDEKKIKGVLESLEMTPQLKDLIRDNGGIFKFIEEQMNLGRLYKVNRDHRNFGKEVLNKKDGDFSIHVLGLGDVGSTMTLGLCLYGKETLSRIGIFDLDSNRMARFEQELNQMEEPLSSQLPKVQILDTKDLFACDLFAFTASVGVPPLTVKEGDVRLVQFEANAKLVEHYVRLAIDASFKGVFAIVSDPVDMLCRQALIESFRYAKEVGKEPLVPEQIRGYGLGVMNGRAAYYAKIEGCDYAPYGRVFGPHGKGLVVANDYRLSAYDENLSERLTQKTVSANLEMRKIGYKPYIAPAIASGAISLVKTLRGEWHYSCIGFNGFYYGCLNRTHEGVQETERLKLSETLQRKILASAEEMNRQWKNL